MLPQEEVKWLCAAGVALPHACARSRGNETPLCASNPNGFAVGAEPSVGPQRLMALMTEEVEGGFRGRPVVMPAFQKDERRAVGEFYQDPALAGPPGGAHERAFLTVPAATQAQTERCAARAARRRRDDDSLPPWAWTA